MVVFMSSFIFMSLKSLVTSYKINIIIEIEGDRYGKVSNEIDV